eukprot:8516023-Pyramimonas_sp.AAC.2
MIEVLHDPNLNVKSSNIVVFVIQPPDKAPTHGEVACAPQVPQSFPRSPTRHFTLEVITTINISTIFPTWFVTGDSTRSTVRFVGGRLGASKMRVQSSQWRRIL